MASLEVIRSRLSRHETTVAASSLFTQSLELLPALKFTKIRCLALGSPTDEFQALYQLAYLRQIAQHLSIEDISVWDPVFSENDRELFEVFNYKVEESECSDRSVVDTTLYYMPHAPRSFVDLFVGDIEPQWILGNDLTVTIGTLSKAKFLAQYPTLALLVKIAEDQAMNTKDCATDEASAAKNEGDEFVVVRRKRNRKAFVEPVLEYNFDLVYFNNVQIDRLLVVDDAPWKDSFSDMALNNIMRKDLEKPKEIAQKEDDQDEKHASGKE